MAIRRLIDAFYDRVEGHDLLSVLFPGGVSEEHRVDVVLWWAEVMGGPADYTERLGGYARMLSHHRDLRITAEQRFRFASTMSRAADDAELPDDPDFRVVLRGYVELGTRLAMHNLLQWTPMSSRRRRFPAGDGCGTALHPEAVGVQDRPARPLRPGDLVHASSTMRRKPAQPPTMPLRISGTPPRRPTVR